MTCDFQGIMNIAASVLTSWIALSGSNQLTCCKTTQVVTWTAPAEMNRGPYPKASKTCQTCELKHLESKISNLQSASDNYSNNVSKGLKELPVHCGH